jgi:hypothetical protein
VPLPLYGFAEGDTIGLLILADEQETVESLGAKLREACSLRVDAGEETDVIYQGNVIDPATTLAQAGFRPLQRFDLRRKHGFSESRNAR